jgi:hypothetical protein
MLNIAFELRTRLGPRKWAILGIRAGLASVRKVGVLSQKKLRCSQLPWGIQQLKCPLFDGSI